MRRFRLSTGPAGNLQRPIAAPAEQAAPAATALAREAVGAAGDWPAELQAVLEICLVHPAPMLLIWGANGRLLYNQACVPLLGARHPAAMGGPWAAAWPELHAALGERLPAGPSEGRLPVTRPDGVVVSVRCTAAPIPLPEGSVAGTLVVLESAGTSAEHPEPTATGHSVTATTGGGPPTDTGPSGTAHAARQTPVASPAASPAAAATPSPADDPNDLADLSSLDVGTICTALGRLTVPSCGQWAIAWIRDTDRAGRAHLDRRDLPQRRRRKSLGTTALAERLAVWRVIDSGETTVRTVPAGHGVPAGTTVTIPLRDKRRVVGALTLGAPANADGSVDGRLQDLTDRAGVALANALRFRIEHGISRDLQRLLAPRPLPSVRGAELAARLIAGSPGVTVGGDWYDAALLPDGRLAVTIGDVVGHGLRPAVEMSQLRTGLRNLALEGIEPAEVLAGADEFLRRTGDVNFVTCLHAVYRPDTGRMDMANAGHLRPVHVPLDGRPRVVAMGSGLPLGGAADLARTGGRGAVATCRIALQPGDTLLMFTDGLVESPSTVAEEGVERLIARLAGPPSTGASLRAPGRSRRRRPARLGHTARQLCELALASMQENGGGERDDVAVLALRRRQPRS